MESIYNGDKQSIEKVVLEEHPCFGIKLAHPIQILQKEHTGGHKHKKIDKKYAKLNKNGTLGNFQPTYAQHTDPNLITNIDNNGANNNNNKT